MEYAIFESSGKQYKVSPGDIIRVENLKADKESFIELSKVLLIASNGHINIGKPTVNGAIIRAKVLDSLKGDKIYVSKFKSKVRNRRKIGFRSRKKVLQIEKIFSSAK